MALTNGARLNWVVLGHSTFLLETPRGLRVMLESVDDPETRPHPRA